MLNNYLHYLNSFLDYNMITISVSGHCDWSYIRWMDIYMYIQCLSISIRLWQFTWFIWVLLSVLH